MSVFSVSFIVFSMFFMLSVKPLCSIVLLPFSAILTNLILFIFHVPNTTVLLLDDTKRRAGGPGGLEGRVSNSKT